MLDFKILGLGGDTSSHSEYPAQFIVGDTDDASVAVLVGCPSNTEDALAYHNLTLADVNRIMVLSLLDSQVGGLERLALNTYYSGAPKKTLYVPEALVDDLWEKLSKPLESVAGSRHTRVTLDVYFNVISLSENCAVVYAGDMELRPFRVPCFPGLHAFGVHVTNTVGKNLVLSPYGVFDRDALRTVISAAENGLVVVGVNDVAPVRCDVNTLLGLTPGQRAQTILCGNNPGLSGFKRVTRGERIVQ